MKKTLGEVNCYYDAQSRFCWEERHLKMLDAYKVNYPPVANLLLLTQKGDETLDFRVAVEYLKGAEMVVEEGGSHSFDGIARHFDTIDSFLELQ